MSRALVVMAIGTAAVAAARGTWSPCGLSMVSAINPFSEAARGYRYAATCVLFTVGSTAAGTAVGAAAAVVAWSVSPMVTSAPTAVAGVALAVTIVCLVAELRLGGFHLPLHPRQVNELWLARYRRWVYATGFGVQVGTGFATYVMSATTYLYVALAVLSGDPWVAVVAGALFGLIRGLAVTLTVRAKDPGSLRHLHRTLDRWAPRSVVIAQAWTASSVVLVAGAVAGSAGSLVGAAVAGTLVAWARRHARTRASHQVGDPGSRSQAIPSSSSSPAMSPSAGA